MQNRIDTQPRKVFFIGRLTEENLAKHDEICARSDPYKTKHYIVNKKLAKPIVTELRRTLKVELNELLEEVRFGEKVYN